MMRPNPRFRKRTDYTREILFFCLGICACVIIGLSVALVLALSNSGGPLLGGNYFAENPADNLEELSYDQDDAVEKSGRGLKIESFGPVDEIANAKDPEPRQDAANDDLISKVDDQDPFRNRKKADNRVGAAIPNQEAKGKNRETVPPDRRDTSVKRHQIPKVNAHAKGSPPVGK